MVTFWPLLSGSISKINAGAKNEAMDASAI